MIASGQVHIKDDDAPTGMLPRVFLFLVVLLLVLWAVPALSTGVLIGLVLYTLKGPKETIQALTLLSILLLLNPGIADVMTYGGDSLRWVILFFALLRVLWDGIIISASAPRQILTTVLLFALTMVVFALLVSFIPAVSILKVTTFTIGVSAILTSFHRTSHLREYWKSWFITFFLFVAVASLPLYTSPLGRLRSVGFQGILLHPQTYGPFLAPTTAWFTALIMFRDNRAPYIIAGAALGWLGIFTSLARTSLLMGAGGLGIAFLTGFFLNARWRPSAMQAITGVRLVVLLFAITGVGIIYGSQTVDAFREFLLKGETEESFEESFEGSRGFLIQQQLENFKNSPLLGIGFGVPSDASLHQINTTGLLRLPTGAAVEKGFMPSAVLEETGIVGAILVLFLLGSIITPAYKWGGISLFAMLVASLLVNMGEMILFSVGGLGLYFWLIIGFCYSLSTPLKGPSQGFERRLQTPYLRSQSQPKVCKPLYRVSAHN